MQQIDKASDCDRICFCIVVIQPIQSASRVHYCVTCVLPPYLWWSRWHEKWRVALIIEEVKSILHDPHWPRLYHRHILQSQDTGSDAVTVVSGQAFKKIQQMGHGEVHWLSDIREFLSSACTLAPERGLHQQRVQQRTHQWWSSRHLRGKQTSIASHSSVTDRVAAGHFTRGSW